MLFKITPLITTLQNMEMNIFIQTAQPSIKLRNVPKQLKNTVSIVTPTLLCWENMAPYTNRASKQGTWLIRTSRITLLLIRQMSTIVSSPTFQERCSIYRAYNIRLRAWLTPSWTCSLPTCSPFQPTTSSQSCCCWE